MPVRPISREQFDALQPAIRPMTRLRVEEREWFADEAGRIIGAITVDPAEEDWGWVILGRDERGEFRLTQMATRLPSHPEARTQLREAMSQIEATGKNVFPRVA